MCVIFVSPYLVFIVDGMLYPLGPERSCKEAQQTSGYAGGKLLTDKLCPTSVTYVSPRIYMKARDGVRQETLLCCALTQ